jgi:hypothetical protein
MPHRFLMKVLAIHQVASTLADPYRHDMYFEPAALSRALVLTMLMLFLVSCGVGTSKSRLSGFGRLYRDRRHTWGRWKKFCANLSASRLVCSGTPWFLMYRKPTVTHAACSWSATCLRASRLEDGSTNGLMSTIGKVAVELSARFNPTSWPPGLAAGRRRPPNVPRRSSPLHSDRMPSSCAAVNSKGVIRESLGI